MSDSCILVKMCVVPNKVSNALKTCMFIYMYTTFRELLTAELESVGIRLNKRKPNIYFKVRHKIIYDKFNELQTAALWSEKMWMGDHSPFKYFLSGEQQFCNYTSI